MARSVRIWSIILIEGVIYLAWEVHYWGGEGSIMVEWSNLSPWESESSAQTIPFLNWLSESSSRSLIPPSTQDALFVSNFKERSKRSLRSEKWIFFCLLRECQQRLGLGLSGALHRLSLVVCSLPSDFGEINEWMSGWRWVGLSSIAFWACIVLHPERSFCSR